MRSSPSCPTVPSCTSRSSPSAPTHGRRGPGAARRNRRQPLIKLPVTHEGFAAIPRIVREGMQVTATGIHSSMQGFMAAKAGARYVAPYVNRMDNYGIDGVRVASEIHRTLRTYDLKADVLAASFKNSEQVLELVRQGVGAITAAPDVLAALIKNPATDAAIADQNRDFGILVGERRTWLDLVNDK